MWPGEMSIYVYCLNESWLIYDYFIIFYIIVLAVQKKRFFVGYVFVYQPVPH